jgi:hypothetical protein
VARDRRINQPISLDVLDRHSSGLFEFLWCPVCWQGVFTDILFERVFCKRCNTQVVLRETRETRGYEEAVLACFDPDSNWNLHVDATLRCDLSDGSARVKNLGAPGAYEVDCWSSAPGEDWEPVERGEVDDIEPPDEMSHLA